MIRIGRPDTRAMAAARAELAAVEVSELTRVGAIAATGRRPSGDDIGTRYGLVKDALAEAQFGQCCYCEKPVEASHSDVEHVRPKTRAQRGPGFSDEGYWWLTWRWDNLLFACVNCNRSAKGDRFPLDPASVCLSVGEPPPGQERPMLVDPLRESPIDVIQFRPAPSSMKPGLWLPVPRNGSPRGYETIRLLRLDRPELHDQYRRHVVTAVRPELNDLKAAEGDVRTFTYQWRRTLRTLLSPGVPFKALSYDVLAAQASVRKRVELGLTVPVPPYRGEG